MASHVVILDSSARRAVVKTTPTKHLSDILQEACEKLSLNPDHHGLKNTKDRTLDLSQPFRLSGLSSGAKLQLTVLSRSPSVVSIALQIPKSDGGSSRFTDKLASTTTLWLLLRHFETSSKLNFTARGVAQVAHGQANGAGRLYHETPVIHVMGRELVSFTELQKTLAQLGFNSGSVLLRLSFRATDRPLEEAMQQIGEYFQSVEGEATGGAHASSVGNMETTPESSEPILDSETVDQPSPAEPQSPAGDAIGTPLSAQPNDYEDKQTPAERPTSFPATSPPPEQTVTGPSQRPITIFAAPSTSTPAAAKHAFNEKDFEPTIDHAKIHQSRLAQKGRNKTLPSDAELAAQADAQAKKNETVKSVQIKVRLPDQMAVLGTFSALDTTVTLYDFVKNLLAKDDQPFSLNFISNKGPTAIPKEGNTRLVAGLGMVGGVLVNMHWDEGASNEARIGKSLKGEYEEKATQIAVKQPEEVEVEDKDPAAKKVNAGDGGGKKSIKGGMPKWFKGIGKK
ncbi:hypothetical protein MMC21_004649 [Puttea exsequens]|nr:hypothetical protein [Puttea exsequens]